MDYFFTNLYNLLTKGSLFINEQLNKKPEESKETLSFTIFLGMLIGAFHGISFLLVFSIFGNISSVGLFIIVLLTACLSVGIAFSKSALFHYLISLYGKENSPIKSREILKVYFLSGYPFFLLPAIAIICSVIKAPGIFIILYITVFIWSMKVKYKIFKERLKIHKYLFRITYAIPLLVQFTVVILVVLIAVISNLFILKGIIINIVKSISVAIKAITG